MQIGAIQLLEFRNYRTLEYTPSPRLNLYHRIERQMERRTPRSPWVPRAGRLVSHDASW